MTERPRWATPGLLTVTTSFARRVALDFIPGGARSQLLEPRRANLMSAIEWLRRAQDATPDDGVSQGYYLLRGSRYGWLPSYRETSGYIATTLFDAAVRLSDDELRQRAARIVNWLLTVQNTDGSFANPNYGDRGIVFDTGQVLLGLVRGYRESNDPRILDAAKRAGQWLADSLDSDGCWRRNTHGDCVHTYNVRCAWAMLQLNEVAPDPEIESAARKNLEWTVAQESAGWFRNNAFTEQGTPFTHNIAYAIRGVFESSLLLNDTELEGVAVRCAEAVLPHVRQDGHIPGQIDELGRSRSRSCCLTGNCQLAIIWLGMAERRGDDRLRDAAKRALSYVLHHQDISTGDANVRGAIAGSAPLVGRYSTLAYPNWATKFFIDAVLRSKLIDS